MKKYFTKLGSHTWVKGCIDINTTITIDKKSMMNLVYTVYKDFCTSSGIFEEDSINKSFRVNDKGSEVVIRIYFKDFDTVERFLVEWDRYVGDFQKGGENLYHVLNDVSEEVRDFINDIFAFSENYDFDKDKAICSKQGEDYYIEGSISFEECE